MSKIILFGSGRGADVAYRFLTRDSDHQVCGFATEQAHLTHDWLHDLPVVAFETVEDRFPPDEYKFLVLLGYQRMNSLRAEKYLAVKSKGYDCISYVNSGFFRAEDLDVGENCFILDNQSLSLDVKVGDNVVMWSSNHVGDLSRIGDHAWVSSHVTVAGEVDVGPRCFLGIGSTISNRLTLGEGTFVGANALIATDTAKGSVHTAPAATANDLDSKSFMRIMMGKGKL